MPNYPRPDSAGTTWHDFALDVLATINAHLKKNSTLTDPQRASLESEQGLIVASAAKLEAANGPYQTFLDTAFRDVRAEQRVADFLVDQAQRSGDGVVRPFFSQLAPAIREAIQKARADRPLSRIVTLGFEATAEVARRSALALQLVPADLFPAAASVAKQLDDAAAALEASNLEAEAIDARRQPLRTAVEKAKLDVRETLDQANGRLRTHFSAAFIESLYPAASAQRSTDDDKPSTPPQPV